MASVRKRTYEDGTSKWVVDFLDDKKNRRLKTFTRKKEADTFRDTIVQRIERGEFTADAETVTFSAATKAWLAEMHRRAVMGDRMTKSTVAMYDCCIRRMEEVIGKLKLNEITIETLQRAVDGMAERLSGSTVQSTYRVTYMLCEFAVGRGWIKRNPAVRKKMRLPAKNRVIKIPSRDEIATILRAAAERGRYEHQVAYVNRLAIVTLALFGGLRRGEVCALQWQDVDFDREVITIRHSLSRLDGLKGPKTKAGRREVPLSTPIIKAMQALLSDGRKMASTEHVIVTRHGKPMMPTHVYGEYWAPLLKKAGVVTPEGKPKYTFHALRHTAVSLLISQKLSPMHIKSMIGHASVTTTIDIYGHLFPSDAAIKIATDEVAAGFYATQTQLEPPTLCNR